MDLSRYDALRPQLATGDVLLFDGISSISGIIKWFTRGKFSHVGMVVRTAEPDTVLALESTTLSSVVDIEAGRGLQGVQLVSLSDRLATYEGEVAFRHLTVHRAPVMLAALSTFRTEIRGRPYEQRKLALLRAAWDGIGGVNAADLSSLFCSELVAEAYQRMGLLPTDPSSSEYVPRDFTAETGMVDRLLRAGATLGPEVCL